MAHEVQMTKAVLLVPVILALAGCGVAETGAAAATAANAKAQEAREGLKTEDRVRSEVEASVKQATERRVDAENASQ